MCDSPIFTVIIPTFNRASQLSRALTSIADQTFTNYEVIVCDDGSTDATKNVVDQFVDRFKIKYIYETNWGGPARPRNNGIKTAKGEWICFLDSDDWWYPNKLETVEKYVSVSDVIYHDLDIYTQKGRDILRKKRGRKLKKPVFVDLMINGNLLPNSSVVVRKSLIDRVGGLAEERSLISSEDFDLWVRLAMVTDNFCHIPQILGAYWAGGENITDASERQIERLTAVFDRHMGRLNEKDRLHAQIYLSHLRGCIKYNMGLTDDAQRLLGISVRSRNLSIRLRSLYLLMRIQLNRLQNRLRLRTR
jgi:glycosyltransferase involved in cell wall biosynthesis